MKRFLLLVLATVFLSGCLDGDNDFADAELVEYDGGFYNFSYPSGWEILTSNELADAPEGALVVFRSSSLINGIFPNISIVQDQIPGDLSSKDFAELNTEKAPLAVENFQTVSKQEIEANGGSTILFTFLGRLREEERDLEWKQIYFTNNNIGVTITAVCSPDSVEDLKNLLKEALRSFSFK